MWVTSASGVVEKEYIALAKMRRLTSNLKAYQYFKGIGSGVCAEY